MLRKISFLLLLVFQAVLFAQTGKVVGTVTDFDTGEPLVGANVLIEGTYLGGATDVNGEYLILNVPPGTYSVKGLYVGYRDLVIENVQVSVGLTTNLDLQLRADTYEAETITIVAQKPLVNKNITNSTNIVSAEDIENLPVRNVTNIVAKEAGVVTQGNNIFVRGSRQDATAYYVDGVKVNNPVFGGAQAALISNAIEEIQFQAGGYSAEYGGANGGIISTHSKTGSDNYAFNVEAITDNFTSVGEEYLGGYSYGYSELILTAGGPLLPDYKKLKFFVAGNNLFRRSPANFYQGVDIRNISDPTTGSVNEEGVKDTFDVYYPDGYRVNDHQNTYNVQGNLTYDLNPISLKLSGTYQFGEGRDGVGLQSFNTRERAGMNENETFTTSLKITHVLSQTSFYDVIVNYFSDFYVNMDPVFKHQITLYGDSIANANAGYPNMQSDGQNPKSLAGYGWTFTREPVVSNTYRKQKTQSMGAKFNLLVQATKNHELKAGAEVTTYEIRRYSLPNPRSIASTIRAVGDGNIKDAYNRLDNYGYDVFGNETDKGLEAPKKPVFAGAYIQDKMEFSDLVVNAGVRLDYIDIDGQEFVNPNNIVFDENDEIDPSSLKDVDPYIYVSPRLGFSFPVTEQTIFHAQYGKFIQQSQLRDVYQGYSVVADNIKGGFAIEQPVGFGLKPEKTTQYDIGFKQQIGDLFAFDITAYYKDIKDQIQIRSVPAEPSASHRQYYAFLNGDFETVKGLEIKFNLRRTNRLSGTLDYTFSSAQGTGSNPSSSFRSIWQSPTSTPYFPEQVAPVDHNQTHRGSINLDYRFSKDDGPSVFGSQIFSQFGTNILATFNSGFNYTRWEGFNNTRIPLEPLNASTTPWFFQLDLRVDKSFEVGPFNANVYVWVINLFNRQNVVDVFNTSSDADSDGYLATDAGAAQIDAYERLGTDNQGRSYADIYSYLYERLTYNSANFGPPRQINLGLRLAF